LDFDYLYGYGNVPPEVQETTWSIEVTKTMLEGDEYIIRISPQPTATDGAQPAQLDLILSGNLASLVFSSEFSCKQPGNKE